jgi:hypothetical protein
MACPVIRVLTQQIVELRPGGVTNTLESEFVHPWLEFPDSASNILAFHIGKPIDAPTLGD